MATVNSRILGPDGQPIQYELLDQEIAAPTMTGVRQVWRDSVASNLDPQRLARILRGAVEGDARDFLTLAEEMEEKDGHYFSVLSTRKLKISGLETRIDAFSDASQDQEIAAAVREVLLGPAFSDSMFDLTDALGKSYAVSEIMWDRSSKPWKPRELIWRDPTFFQFDRVSGQELRLIDEADMFNGVALAPFKFIVHRPKLRSGLPIRGGLARLAAPSFMCKAWSWKDWMAFADVFGMPMRIGKYQDRADPKDISKLMAAVANLGTDAAAVIPKSMEIEFNQAANVAGAGDFFEKLANFWDKQVSKGVLGQTMTTDDGSSHSQAEVHNEVRLDLLTADARALSTTLNRDLVRPFVDLNFGPGRYPRLVVVVPEPEDTAALIDALETLVPMGLEVEVSVIRDKLGLADPPKGKDVKLLTAAKVATPDAAAPGTPPIRAVKAALNAEQQGVSPAREDQLVALLASRADPMVMDWVQSIERLVKNAVSIEEIRDGLLKLLPDMPADRFAQVMEQALTIAGVAGMSDATEESRA